MTEQELQKTLNQTRDFLGRQQLLKQLWGLQKQQQLEAARPAVQAKAERPQRQLATDDKCCHYDVSTSA